MKARMKNNSSHCCKYLFFLSILTLCTFLSVALESGVFRLLYDNCSAYVLIIEEQHLFCFEAPSFVCIHQCMFFDSLLMSR